LVALVAPIDQLPSDADSSSPLVALGAPAGYGYPWSRWSRRFPSFPAVRHASRYLHHLVSIDVFIID